MGILAGVILLVVGIILIANAHAVLAIFPIIAGLVITISGIFHILQCLSVKAPLKHKSLLLLGNAAVTVLGVVIMVNPFSTAVVMTAIVGLVLMVNAVLGFLFGVQID